MSMGSGAMPWQAMRWGCVAVLVGCLATGCEWFQGPSESDLDALADVEPLEDGEGSATAAGESAAVPVTLNLQVGDRFPLLKTVDQTLIQSSPQGNVVSASSLEILFAITVEETPTDGPRAGQRRLGVQYHQVRFSQDLGGTKVDYDSRRAPTAVPLEALGYQGLVGNGFYFWLGADNQIQEMVGFSEFIERCLRGVPMDRRDEVRAALAATSGAEGFANVVDDSIGLLPGSGVQVGDKWNRTRQVQEPLRMHLTTQYVLETVSENLAEVGILGAIAAAYQSSGVPGREIDVTVKSGKLYGKCTLDLRTGLPLQSTVEQVLDMTVRLPDGRQFDQRKKTTTTVRAFPESSGGEGPRTIEPGQTAALPGESGPPLSPITSADSRTERR